MAFVNSSNIYFDVTFRRSCVIKLVANIFTNYLKAEKREIKVKIIVISVLMSIISVILAMFYDFDR